MELMQQNSIDYDPDELIEAVRRRRGLWDAEAEGYRSKNMRRQMWFELVKEVCPASERMTKSEVRELVVMFQKKWKSIRDYFVRTTGQDEQPIRPYLKKLCFLQKDQGLPEPTQSGNESDEAEKNNLVLRKRIKLSTKRERKSEDSTEATGSEYLDIDDVGEQPMHQFSFATADSLGPEDRADPDKLFLLSLLPHLKSVPESRKLNAKVELMHVLQNANCKKS